MVAKKLATNINKGKSSLVWMQSSKTLSCRMSFKKSFFENNISDVLANVCHIAIHMQLQHKPMKH
mgnify:CR=1 FL=1